MKTQYEEVCEAIAAGENVLQQIQYVEGHLSSAKTWGFIDMFSKGGFISALAKHSKLSDAENAMNQLSYSINMFNSELSDIHINNNVGQITLSSGMQLADWFFDGLLVDAITLSHIGDSQNQVRALRAQVENAMQRLYYLKETIEKQR